MSTSSSSQSTTPILLSTTTTTSAHDRFLASLLAAALAETFTLPLDTVKTRLQVQQSHIVLGEPKPKKSAKSVAKELLKEGGIRAFWKGLTPSLLRQMLYTSFSFLFYEPLKDYLLKFVTSPIDGHVSLSNALKVRILAGGTSGAIGIAVMNWTVVIKVKSQTMNNNNNVFEITNMIRICQNIIKTDGWWGFLRGIRSNMLRTFVVNAVEIGIYDQIRDSLLELMLGGGQDHSPHSSSSSSWTFFFTSFIVTLCASFIAGTLSAMFSTPFDTISTLYMEEAGGQAALTSGGGGISIMALVKSQGIGVLWQGFIPICIRKTLWVLVFWLCYGFFIDRQHDNIL
jgi:hypothetical protein